MVGLCRGSEEITGWWFSYVPEAWCPNVTIVLCHIVTTINRTQVIKILWSVPAVASVWMHLTLSIQTVTSTHYKFIIPSSHRHRMLNQTKGKSIRHPRDWYEGWWIIIPFIPSIKMLISSWQKCKKIYCTQFLGQVLGACCKRREALLDIKMCSNQ